MRSYPLLPALLALVQCTSREHGQPSPTAASAAIEAPATPKRPVTDEYHGTRVVDPYQWLENGADPEVKEWERAEVHAARAVLDKLPARDAIRKRVTELLTSASAEYLSLQQVGGKLFALKKQPPKQQPFVVVMGSADDPGAARTVLDPNEVDATGHTAIDFYAPSLDGKRIAVSLSRGGSESGDVHVYDVATGTALKDVVPRVNGGTAGGSVAWNREGTGFYYTRYPRTGERPPVDLDFYQQVWFHKLGTDTSEDQYAVGKDFPRIAETELKTSEDGKYVLASVANGDGGQFAFWLLGPTGGWSRIADFDAKLVRVVFGPDDDLYAICRDGAPRGKVIRMPARAPDPKTAKTIVEEGETVIENVELTRSRAYLVELDGGPSRVRAVSTDGKPIAEVPTEPVSAVREIVHVGDDDVLLNVQSFTLPPGWYQFHAAAKETKRTALVQTSAATFDDAEVVRETCTSKDGTKVPLSIIRRKGTKLDGSGAALLNGYGGFAVTISPKFRPINRLWLDQGGVFAVANLRGGEEFGESWHLAGNLTHKQNVFDDFAACAQHLIDAGYARPPRLGIIGGSNGGLLMGAALTQHPELFGAVVSMVGIYDSLRVELTPNGAFNVTEYGTVKDPEQFKALYAYSPYHHVKDATPYPAVLLLTGANDPRVDPYHSRKMAARLQAATSSGKPILLRSSDDTGHGGATPLSAQIEENVDVYSFLFHELGIKYEPH